MFHRRFHLLRVMFYFSFHQLQYDLTCPFLFDLNKNQKLTKRKDLEYGRSITDACINIETTNTLLGILYDSIILLKSCEFLRGYTG